MSRRIECPSGHWFDADAHDRCPADDGGEPCDWPAPALAPPPPPVRENFDRPVAAVDRDALAVMPTERVVEVHKPGIAECRAALAEAEYRKRRWREGPQLVTDGVFEAGS